MPEAWTSATIGELLEAELFTDGDWVESKDQDPEGEVRLIQLADIGVGHFKDSSDRWLTREKAKELSCTFLEPDDVLVARLPDPLGRTCLLPDLGYSAITAVDIAVLRPGENLDNRWLREVLNSQRVQKRILAFASGTTRKRISRRNLATIELLVPPLPEQRKIAAILSSVDEAIATTGKVIEQTKHVKKGLLQTLMTRGIGQTRLKKTEIGDLPENWEVIALGQAISSLNAGVSVRSEDRLAGEGELGVLKTGSVAEGRFLPSEHKAILPEEQERARESPTAGRIIISRMNTQQLVGESGYVRRDHPGLFLPDRLWQAELHETAGVDAEWLSMALISPGIRERIRMLGTGTSGSMKNISQQRLLKLKIPRPPQEEQSETVDLVKRVDKLEVEAAKEREALETLKRGLLQDLLTGRVRVQPD